MKKITISITAFVTDEGFEDRIEGILDDDTPYNEEGNTLETHNAFKVVDAIDNKYAEVHAVSITVENAELEVKLGKEKK